MTKLITLMIFSMALAAHAEEVFRYPVVRVKLTRDERGDLQIDNHAVAYKSENGKTTISIPLQDIREANVSDPKLVRIETYDVLKRKLAGRRVYTFRLREGNHDKALARFLAENLKRPVIGAFELPSEGSFEIPAYHSRRLGGSHGKLLINDAGIRFVSDKPGESRTWLYRDIETIGSMNEFHFRVSTLVETYNLDLKERLPEQAYDKAWRNIFQMHENAVK